MLTNWLRSIRITRISLALVGLMWVFPFLHDRHENPLTTFDQEWWSAVLGLLAMSALLAKDYWQAPAIPRIVQFPVALIVIALLQMAMGKVAYYEQGLLYLLYLLFAVLLMMLGAWLRRSLGIEKLACTLAIFLLVGAELSAGIGVLQHFGWHSWLDSVIVRKISSGVYGNIAQPNHYANYIALGLISLGLLYQQQKLKVGYVALLALPLLFVLTLSGSRSSWLYLLLSLGLAGWAWYRNRGLRPVLQYMFALLLGFLLMHLLVQLPMFSGADSATTALRTSDTSGRIRLYLWREATMIFMQSPLLGVGFGQFAIHHFELLPKLHATNITDLYNNAHNFIFQLAAETGLAGLVALFVSVAVWLYGLRHVRLLTAAHWWGYAAVGVLTIHGLLEYPLWYTYFIAIIAVLLGMLDETEYRLEMRNVGRVSLAFILLVGLATMLQLQHTYSQLKSTLSMKSTDAQRTLDGLLALRGSALLVPYTEFFIGPYTEVDAQNIEMKLKFNGRLMRFLPTSDVVYRQAYLLAQDGQLAAAKQVLEQAIWSYPGNGNAHKLLLDLAEKDPAHFSALLEFANQKEQEHARAVRSK